MTSPSLSDAGIPLDWPRKGGFDGSQLCHPSRTGAPVELLRLQQASGLIL